MTVADTAMATGVDTGADLAYDGVLIAGFGGPEGQDDVMPFLRNVTRGRGIPDERLEEVAHHYRTLGGTSPINAQTRALRDALQDELTDRNIHLAVLWGNRNWHPFMAETIDAARDSGRLRLLAVATSAYSSYSGCRQYREDFGGALLATDAVGQVRIDKIRPYYDQPGFLEPFADATSAAVRSALDAGFAPDELEIVFTTHSVPDSMADSSGSATLGDHGDGGAYVAQHRAACGYVVDRLVRDNGFLSDVGWQLAYQSRSGAPSTPWLDPDINDVLRALATAGRRAVIVVPIGFVSDHVEVIWDLDTEAAETAADLGLAFWRVPTPGVDPRFVSGLADLVAERLGRGLPHEALLALPVRPDFCAPGCCVNARTTKPTTAGQDSARDWAGTDVPTERLVASGIRDVGSS